MTTVEKDSMSQTNLGSNVYATLGGFHFSFSKHNPMRNLLAGMSEAEKDLKSLENEDCFAERFWRGASLPVRQQLLDMKAKCAGKLTDEGVRILRKSGCLVDRENILKINLGRRTMVATQIAMALVSLFCFCANFAYVVFPASPAQQASGQISILIIWFAVAVPAYLYVMRPWRILKDAGLV